MAEMKWSPMKSLTDEEYVKMLRENLVKIEAEMALIGEDLKGLRAEVEKKRRGAEEGKG